MPPEKRDPNGKGGQSIPSPKVENRDWLVSRKPQVSNWANMLLVLSNAEYTLELSTDRKDRVPLLSRTQGFNVTVSPVSFHKCKGAHGLCQCVTPTLPPSHDQSPLSWFPLSK